MQIISDERSLELTGDFDQPSAHQLVLEGCAGFVIGATFANGDTSRHASESIAVGRKSIFTQIDGGGVLVTGKSNLVFEDCVFRNNISMMCGGGVSLQTQPGSKITFKNCQFLGNNAADTGSAIDLLTPNQIVVVEKSVFEGNSTTRWADTPRGHISVFPNNRLKLISCDFKDGDVDVDYHGQCDIEVDTDKYRIQDVGGQKNLKAISKVLTIARAWRQHPAYLPRI